MKQLPITSFNYETMIEKYKLINDMIEKFGPAEVMSVMYQREDFIIPNWYDYRQIAEMWDKTEESVIENWDEIQIMMKSISAQGGLKDVLEQGEYLEDWQIDLVEN